MTTQNTQIKLNIPLALRNLLAYRAKRFGLPVSTYLKHLIIQDVKEVEYPVFQASEQTENAYRLAQEEKQNAREVKGNISMFIDSL